MQGLRNSGFHQHSLIRHHMFFLLHCTAALKGLPRSKNCLHLQNQHPYMLHVHN